MTTSGTRERIGRYEIEPLAESGMSTVYAGRDGETGREVVLKVVPTADFDRATALVRERELLIRLDHPGIVRCLELFKDGERTVMVLERVPGEDLGRLPRLRDESPEAREATVRAWGIELAEILSYLHDQLPPVIYRDLKPSNIICRPDGHLVLVDFGAIRVRSDRPRDTVGLGTPGYAPPEQYGGGASDERSDVYALGATLFELLSGRDPAEFGFAFPPLADLGISVSAPFARVIARALSPSLDDRFPSMHAMLEALRASGPGRSIRLPAPGLVPLAAAAMAAGAATVAAPTWPERYGAAIALLAVTAMSGLAVARGSRSAGEDDQPAWRRRLSLGLMLLGALALGLAPLALPLRVVQAHLRRLSLDAYATAVPLDGSPLVLAGFTLLVALFGYLSGRALLRRHGWVWPAALLAFVGGLFLGHVAVDVCHDRSVLPIASETAWTRDLGALNVTFDDMTMVAGRSDGRFFAVVRSGPRGFQVLDWRDGHTVWSGESNARMPLNGDPGVLYVLDGRTLVGRAIEDGRALWRYQAPVPVELISRFDGVLLASLSDGRLVALDRAALERGETRVAWTFARCHPGANVVAMGSDSAAAFDGESDTLYALALSTGQVRWSRPFPAHGGLASRMVGTTFLYVDAQEVEGIDPATGRAIFRFQLPSGLGGPDQFAPMRLAAVDASHVLVQRGGSVFHIALDSGRVSWRVNLPGEPLALHEDGPGVMFLETASGKLMGLEAASGRVTWEWWPGGFLDHLLPPPVAHLAYTDSMPRPMIQERPGAPLGFVDPSSGRMIWRHGVPEGYRVRRMIDDGESLLLLGRDDRDHSVLVAVPRPAELQPQSFGAPQ
jgi:outer membrane protein assembly factor BamB